MNAMAQVTKNTKPISLQSGQMKQQCPNCGEGARIRHSAKITNKTAEYYMQCQNIACGMTWKSQMDVIHIISPSADAKPDLDIPISPYSERKFILQSRKNQKDDDPDDQISIFEEIDKAQA